ncbi:MAG: alkaline phosphatase family protein [Spirochaetales bacterium]|nr:alkaline phosphatase family protein [Spirochaetales bacterium]
MIQRPDYRNSIVNLSCSVLKYFNVPDVKHSTLPEADKILDERKPRNVVMLLFDAMGISILERHLPADSFTRRHVLRTISSTFPPTTVAATTAVNSGLTPLETGWLGWVTYFSEIDDNIITFFNTLQSEEDKQAAPTHLTYSNVPYKTLSMQIRETNPEVRCMACSPFKTHPIDPTIITHSIRENMENILRLAAEPGPHMLYGYWPDPDHMMHELGIDHPQITPILQDIDSNLKYLHDNINKSDTAVFVIADHSQINAKWFCLCDYPDIQALLKHPHSIEGRCASFMVKDGKKEEFRKLFKKHFGDHFLLMDHDEFINSGLLGSGVPHPRTDGFVGDYVAIATDEYTIGEAHEDTEMVGIHAGLTKEEMEVPLIAF